MDRANVASPCDQHFERHIGIAFHWFSARKNFATTRKATETSEIRYCKLDVMEPSQGKKPANNNR
jgi:hypothetical protein